VQLQVFPVAGLQQKRHRAATAAAGSSRSGDIAVASDRAMTGFGGMIAVTVILFATQLITGVGAFPL
jgi:hypothetical protein